VKRISIFLGLIAVITALFWNELNVHSLNSSPAKLSIGKTIVTADDPSYLVPVENFLNANGWRNNLDGSFSYYMRPPGYSVVYLAFRSWLTEKHALNALKLFQVLLFGLSISVLFLLFQELNVRKNISLLLISFYACGGIGIGFLYYTLTEAITPSLLIFTFYFLIRAKNTRIGKTKRAFYFYSFLLFGFLFITRPVLGIFALPFPFFIFWDDFFTLKKKVQYFFFLLILGFGPMLIWQTRAYQISGEIVGLHPIYSVENLQTPYRPVHQAFWEFAKSWGEKGDDFHSYTDEFWATSHKNALDTSSVLIILKKIPKSVVQELGDKRLKKAFESYRLAILEQRQFVSEIKVIPEANFKNELDAINQFNELKNEYRKNHFWTYHFVEPIRVFKELTFHSNLSLNLFQNTWRGNFLMEFWRYTCAFFHLSFFLILPLTFFLKSITRETKIIVVSTMVYIFYLVYFQRGIEERYSLPILPLLILNFGIVVQQIWTKYFKKTTPEIR
jgi:hypothetical protein